MGTPVCGGCWGDGMPVGVWGWPVGYTPICGVMGIGGCWVCQVVSGCGFMVGLGLNWERLTPIYGGLLAFSAVLACLDVFILTLIRISLSILVMFSVFGILRLFSVVF